MRIVGGCDAGHVPWYVFLDINGGCQNINSKNLTKNILLSTGKFSLTLHLGGKAGDWGIFGISEVRVLKGWGSKCAVSIIMKHCWKNYSNPFFFFSWTIRIEVWGSVDQQGKTAS